MLARVASATILGVQGRPVVVEVHVSDGLPGFTVVGLPDTACRESRDRVRAAVLSSGYTWPQKRVTVNLAPSGIPKTGAVLDLAIAVALLGASEQVPTVSMAASGFLGELGLDGSVRAIAGALPLADSVEADVVVVPVANLPEVRLVVDQRALGVSHLREVASALRGEDQWPQQPTATGVVVATPQPDLCELRGQSVPRLAVEVAAAGGHHLLMVGPPGAGKTMLARRLPSVLPPLNAADALDVTRVHSAAGVAAYGLVRRPPFRAPHHGASAAALIGGGTGAMRPGEISLAHGGVLFLDELGEFAPAVLDSLRQPLEEGVVRVARVGATVEYPARFLLVAAMNPCPCGEAGGPGQCRCTENAQARYHRRLSGPLVDRFDLRVRVARPAAHELLDGPPGEASAPVADRVLRARELASARGVTTNAQLSPSAAEDHAPMTVAAIGHLRELVEQGRLSARGVHRIRLVARTIADLRGDNGTLDRHHVALAVQLRADVVGPVDSVPVGWIPPRRLVAPNG